MYGKVPETLEKASTKKYWIKKFKFFLKKQPNLTPGANFIIIL